MACPSLLSDDDLRRFRTKPCQREGCEFGVDRCQYSHCAAWARRCPFYLAHNRCLRYIPLVCPDVVLDQGAELPGWQTVGGVKANYCQRGGYCPFAHSLEELNYHPLTYKTLPCSFFSSGNCTSYYCPFVHGTSERRNVESRRFFLPFVSPDLQPVVAATFPSVIFTATIPKQSGQQNPTPPRPDSASTVATIDRERSVSPRALSIASATGGNAAPQRKGKQHHGGPRRQQQQQQQQQQHIHHQLGEQELQLQRQQVVVGGGGGYGAKRHNEWAELLQPQHEQQHSNGPGSLPAPANGNYRGRSHVGKGASQQQQQQQFPNRLNVPHLSSAAVRESSNSSSSSSAALGTSKNHSGLMSVPATSRSSSGSAVAASPPTICINPGNEDIESAGGSCIGFQLGGSARGSPAMCASASSMLRTASNSPLPGRNSPLLRDFPLSPWTSRNPEDDAGCVAADFDPQRAVAVAAAAAANAAGYSFLGATGGSLDRLLAGQRYAELCCDGRIRASDGCSGGSEQGGNNDNNSAERAQPLYGLLSKAASPSSLWEHVEERQALSGLLASLAVASSPTTISATGPSAAPPFPCLPALTVTDTAGASRPAQPTLLPAESAALAARLRMLADRIAQGAATAASIGSEFREINVEAGRLCAQLEMLLAAS